MRIQNGIKYSGAQKHGFRGPDSFQGLPGPKYKKKVNFVSAGPMNRVSGAHTQICFPGPTTQKEGFRGPQTRFPGPIASITPSLCFVRMLRLVAGALHLHSFSLSLTLSLTHTHIHTHTHTHKHTNIHTHTHTHLHSLLHTRQSTTLYSVNDDCNLLVIKHFYVPI